MKTTSDRNGHDLDAWFLITRFFSVKVLYGKNDFYTRNSSLGQIVNVSELIYVHDVFFFQVFKISF